MSTDLGILLGIFILGISISPSLSRWSRALMERFRLLRSRTLRARLKRVEEWMEQESDLTDRINKYLN